MNLVGHDKWWSKFNKAYQSGKMHHGWIFAGPRGIGKASFAKQIARVILDEQGQYNALFDAGSFPDLYIITRPPKEEPKEGEGIAANAELKRSINIDQIRKLQSKLTTRASVADKRVIIIDAADDMERGGANALLKSLEEPPRGTIFILISHAIDRLLPTIKSRCQLMRFDPLSDQDMMKVLSTHDDIAETERSALIKAASGSPGQALAFKGLDLAEIEAAMDHVRQSGDASNEIRTRLIKLLSLKAAQKKYEAFLRRVPSYIAANAENVNVSQIDSVCAAYDKSNILAARAMNLSLDKPAVIFEMVRLLSTLQTHKPNR